MVQTDAVHQVGRATVTKIFEMSVEGSSFGESGKGVPAAIFYPDCDPAVAEAEGRKLGPNVIDVDSGLLRIEVHSWLVRTPTQVVLIDPGAGNSKSRPSLPPFDQLNEPFLARLRAAGAEPEDINLVLHTHLHADHVGWNTRRVNGRWEPTFPTARHLFSRREVAYAAALSSENGAAATIRAEADLGRMVTVPIPGVYEDSILPLIEAGLLDDVAVDGTEIADGFFLLPSPGHSIDHGSIEFVSDGERAFFWGDVVHNPIQFNLPSWNSMFCEFPEAAERSRRWAVRHAADTGALVFTTHFAGSSVGRVTRDDDRFAWSFV